MHRPRLPEVDSRPDDVSALSPLQLFEHLESRGALLILSTLQPDQNLVLDPHYSLLDREVLVSRRPDGYYLAYL